jgi:dienelactone hydrolase
MTHAVLAVSVQIPDGAARLNGDLTVPAPCAGLVIFAHGSGSSRFSLRNRHVAETLQAAGFGTLLLDLLTQQEEAVDVYTTEYRFDIPRLGRRVISAMDWAVRQRGLEDLKIGLFGASTGAAAALIAAAARPELAGAVVSRGGRPDLAGDSLAYVRAPTLLIVGGQDEPVIDLNEDAKREMKTTVRLEIVAGATHLFEEPGALGHVERLAADWFRQYLRPGGGDEMLDRMAPGEP